MPHGANPPTGAILYYNLQRAPRTPVTLEIVDSKGAHGVITDFDSKNHGAAGGIVSPVQSTWT